MGKEHLAADREITEYRTLCASLSSLHEKLLARREEVRRLLEETARRKKEAFTVLAKANRFTRYLTGRQRMISNVAYRLGEIKARIKETEALVFSCGVAESRPEIRAEWKNRRELRQKGLILLSLIDGIKKKLLQLDLLELRCRELILSINKVLEAFRGEFDSIRKKLYPFGAFSSLYRSLRRLFGSGYFTAGDLNAVAALGKITCLVLTIADSPII